MMRVALVNDLVIALECLRRVIETIPDAEIAWSAKDGREALERCRADTPDVILMDLIMPVMDGVESTRRIMEECPCPIVVVTATVEGNSSRVYEALGHGALDAVNTPILGTSGTLEGGAALVRKIKSVRRLTEASAGRSTPHRSAAAVPTPPSTLSTIVAIGASTGGPQALVPVLRDLPRPLRCPVVVVQHVDECFAGGLADWLAAEAELPVQVAASGQRLEPKVWLASTSDHLVLRRHGALEYTADPRDNVYRPSVDVFFESLITAGVAPGTAALLTGMGRDGAKGLLALRHAGWHTIAQDRGSSVVWGMPGAAVELDAAVEVLPVERIGMAIAGRCGTAATRGERS